MTYYSLYYTRYDFTSLVQRIPTLEFYYNRIHWSRVYQTRQFHSRLQTLLSNHFKSAKTSQYFTRLDQPRLVYMRNSAFEEVYHFIHYNPYILSKSSRVKIILFFIVCSVQQYCHTRAPSWILSYAENLASFSLQDGATKWLYYAVGTDHPPHRISWKSVG